MEKEGKEFEDTWFGKSLKDVAADARDDGENWLAQYAPGNSDIAAQTASDGAMKAAIVGPLVMGTMGLLAILAWKKL